MGLNYAYYEPPGAQVLHSNPLFVRSHDFSASSIQGIDEVWGSPALIGIGATAGGGAYLIGSLADLPYVLALTEEDFISPEKLQALIWRETVPELLVNAILPRWWGVSQDELHAAALYQRAGEELLTASAKQCRIAPEGDCHLLRSHGLGSTGRDGAGARISRRAWRLYTNRIAPLRHFSIWRPNFAGDIRIKLRNGAGQPGAG